MSNMEEKLDRLYPKLSINRSCVICGAKSENQHHIIPRANLLLRYDCRNLLSLCYKCHKLIHDKGMYNRGMDFIDEETKSYLLKMKNIDFKQYLLELGITKEDFFKTKEKEIIAHIGKTDYKQNTADWLNAKNYGIGASEIASVVKSFIPQSNLMAIMGDKPAINFLNEDLYSTGYQVYHKIKRGYRLEPIPDELSIFGHAMERYLDYKVQDHSDFIFEPTDDFIKRPDISKYAVCSPDGYATSKSGHFVDINLKHIQTNRLVWEKKTVNPFKAVRENVFYNGLPWQYIFQLQYQMLLKDVEAGILTSMVLEEDTSFNRGRIVSLIDNAQFDKIDELFNIRIDHFIYGVIPEIRNAILVALDNFEKAIDRGNIPDINDKCPRLAENDFKIYQAVYKQNPDARKLATSQDEFNGTTLYEFINDYIGLNEVIKDNKAQDTLNKVLLKKYMFDNKLCEIYTIDGGSVKLSSNGSLLTRSLR